MEAIPELEADVPFRPPDAADTIKVQSHSSSMIKLDADASEGESLDSNVLLAMAKEQASQSKRKQQASAVSRSSHELAENLLRNSHSRQDSTRILAHQIESLRAMEQ